MVPHAQMRVHFSGQFRSRNCVVIGAAFGGIRVRVVLDLVSKKRGETLRPRLCRQVHLVPCARLLVGSTDTSIPEPPTGKVLTEPYVSIGPTFRHDQPQAFKVTLLYSGPGDCAQSYFWHMKRTQDNISIFTIFLPVLVQFVQACTTQ